MTEQTDAPVEASPDEAVAVGVQMIRTGRFAAAENVFDQVLEAFPDHPNALHFMGLLRAQQQHMDEAIALVVRAVEVAPDNAHAWNNLGNLYLQTGRPNEAAEAYQRCLSIAPDAPEALANIGFMLRRIGAIDDAEFLYRRALAEHPDFPEALNNLGAILVARRAYEEAEPLLKRAIEVEPQFSAPYTNLGRICTETDRKPEAIDWFYRSIAAQPSDTVAHKLLIYTHYRLGERDKAAEAARKWLALMPEDPDAIHHHAAITGENVPDRCSDAYVAAVFDRYADTFESSLARLEYRAPAVCAEAIARFYPEPKGDLDILDAGCGTGLCAPYLKPYARHLIGIDLSEGMLGKAATRDAYDDLAKAELTAYMAAAPGRFDLVVSADTLIYFGAMETVFATARAALKPGGAFVFTLEAIEPGDDRPYRVHPATGRYAHARAYVEATVKAAGFRIEIAEEVSVRTEAAVPVSGFLFTLVAA